MQQGITVNMASLQFINTIICWIYKLIGSGQDIRLKSDALHFSIDCVSLNGHHSEQELADARADRPELFDLSLQFIDMMNIKLTESEQDVSQYKE